VWDGRHQLLAGYALAMGEPAAAIHLLRPLTTLYHQQGNAFALSWRATRRFNQQLAAQGALLQA
jgi:hypothetical protein